MGGNATFAGTTYQSRVIAVIYVHILAQMRLGWLTSHDDTPLAVSGETDGPGDDARIEFGARLEPIEVQAKHGLTAGGKLDEVIDRILSKSIPNSPMRVVLAINRASSRTVSVEFANDLDRIRTGRRDALKTEATRILARLGDDSSLLRLLHVVVIDVDRAHEPEMKLALHLLASVLENPEQSVAAMSLLANDASDVCAQRLHRTRKDLVSLLTDAGIPVRPPAKDERWLRQLDFCRQLVERGHASAALAHLVHLEAELKSIQVEPLVRYRVAQQQAAAQLHLDRHEDALRSARRALDIDPNGDRALAVAAISAMHMGDLAMAKAYVARGISAHPEEPRVWGAQAQIAMAAGEPLPTAPASVRNSEHYRRVLAQIAVENNDWSKVLEITASLLADGARQPGVLLMRAHALLGQGDGMSDTEERARCEDAERLSSEVIEALSDDTHPSTTRALTCRALARRRLGRGLEADSDLEFARKLATDDLEAIAQVVIQRMEDGNDEAALEILRHPKVEQAPLLLALRAQLLAERGEKDAARRDLAQSINAVADSYNPDNVRFAAAEAAILLGEQGTAERILSSLTAKSHESARYFLSMGRLSFGRRDGESAQAYYREAAQRSSLQRSEILAELGANLARAGLNEKAAEVFGEIELGALPKKVLRVYASTLMEVNALASVQKLVEHLAQCGPLPDWALSVATNIALRQEDSTTALGYLSALLERGEQSPHVRIVLTRLLLEERRSDEAQKHLGALVSDPRLSPTERMQTAQLLRASGRTREALSFAFDAFRSSPQDPQMHRAFIMLVLTSQIAPDEILEIGPNTHVRLKDENGRTRDVTIFSAPPIDPSRGEMTVDDARAASLIGRRVGDVVVRDKLGWQERRWTVEQILPALVHAAQDAMLQYEERFPQESFFMTGFSVGDLTSIKDLAPLIASVHARKTRVQEIVEMCRNQVLPLEFVAGMLSTNVVEVMRQASSPSEEVVPLFVEWADLKERTKSRVAAFESNLAVLTRSALKTAFDLGLTSRLVGAYKLIAPRALLQQLRREADEAERSVGEGQSMLGSGDIGLLMEHLPSGHPHLVRRLEDCQAQLGWLESEVCLEPRPLSTIHPTASREEEARDMIGHESADALALSEHLGVALYCDDLGLRRLLPADGKVRSFSTVGLLGALADRGVVSPEERDRLLLVLVNLGYMFVHPTVELLVAALKHPGGTDRNQLAQTFGLLAGPALSLSEAAIIAASVIRWLVTAPIQVASLESVTRLVLQSLSIRWPVSQCGREVARAAGKELVLLPRQLENVRSVCLAFVRGEPLPL